MKAFRLFIIILLCLPACRNHKTTVLPTEEVRYIHGVKVMPASYYTKERIDSFLDDANRKIAIQPTAQQYWRKACYHSLIGDHIAALKDIDTGLVYVSPNDTINYHLYLLFKRAACYEDLQQEKEAEDTYKDIIKQYPDNLDAVEALSSLYYGQARYKEARAALPDSLYKEYPEWMAELDSLAAL